VKINKLK
jgi:hypothetical protein